MNRALNMVLRNKFTLAVTVMVLAFTGYYFGLTLARSYKWLMMVTVLSAVLCLGFEMYALHLSYKVEGLDKQRKVYIWATVLVLSTLVVLIALPQFIMIYSALVSILMAVVSLKYYDLTKEIYGNLK